MRRTTYGTGQLDGRTSTQFATGGILASFVGKWKEYRMLRDAESLPFAVMKDIGFRAAEHTNAK